MIWFNSSFTEYKFCTIPTDGEGEPSIKISDSEEYDESFVIPTPTPPPVSTLAPTPTPTPDSATVIYISEEENDDSYTFKIVAKGIYGTVNGYAALYDTDGKLISVYSIPINTNFSYIEVKKSPYNACAKVFVWGGNMQPFTNSKSYKLTPTETAVPSK